ncbi:MAG: class D beta-lactamase [Pseudomonadota bacterium]
MTLSHRAAVRRTASSHPTISPAHATQNCRTVFRTRHGNTATLIAILTAMLTITGLNALPAFASDDIFAANDVTGTFVGLDSVSGKLTVVNATRAQQRMIPASTFKIANSLIALEAGIVRDDTEILPYGGKPDVRKRWARDMSLAEAIAVSNVPIYQKLAQRIGLKTYATWLAKLGYGNQRVGDRVDMFWLSGPLAISAVEQARFLVRLAEGRLPMSARSQKIVRRILRVDACAHGDKSVQVFAKTGWTIAPDPDIGWWVGWVERAPKQIFAFALNIDIRNRTDAAKRVRVGCQFLTSLGALHRS